MKYLCTLPYVEIQNVLSSIQFASVSTVIIGNYDKCGKNLKNIFCVL